MNTKTIALVLFAVLAAGVVAEGVLLRRAYVKQGELQASLTTATDRLKLINEVQRQVDRTHATNNALSDEQLFKDILPKAPAP